MKQTFTGFPSRGLSFFRDLAKNNSRQWFTPRKELFEQAVHTPMLDLVTAINEQLRKFAADYVTEPKKAVFRIYRDTRFSKDKTPYKTNTGAIMHHRRLPKTQGPGFYIGVSHEGVDIAAGMYMPGPDELAAVRKAIVADQAGFERLINAKALVRSMGKLQGEKLARVPKSFAPDSPVADLLRMKQFYFYVVLPAKRACDASIVKEVAARFRLMAPLVNFLADALLRSRDEEGETEAVPRRPVPMF